MNLAMGNKNVVIGLVVILLFLAMSVHIERTASQLAFNAKAAAAVVDTKNNSPNLLEHQITDVRKGPAYRTGGIYFTNHYAASYVPVPNNFYFTAYNMRLYAWLFALFGIAVGFIVGIQTRASLALRQWASWLAVAAVVLYPIRDVYFFWGRWINPSFSGGWVSQVVYPLKNLGGVAMGLALLLSLIVFLQGAKAAEKS
ncbi:MAG: hypothetical protein WCI75_09020 [candidate division NC10 bacterium]